MKDANKRLGQVVRELRKQQRLTQEDLAEASGIHEKHIGVIERGIQGASLTYLCKLAEGLNISVVELMKRLFESEKTEKDKEKVLKDIQSFLQRQPMKNLKLIQHIIYQFRNF